MKGEGNWPMDFTLQGLVVRVMRTDTKFSVFSYETVENQLSTNYTQVDSHMENQFINL